MGAKLARDRNEIACNNSRKKEKKNRKKSNARYFEILDKQGIMQGLAKHFTGASHPIRLKAEEYQKIRQGNLAVF